MCYRESHGGGTGSAGRSLTYMGLVGEGLTDKGTFEQRSEKSEGGAAGGALQ